MPTDTETDKKTDSNQELLLDLHNKFTTAISHPTWTDWREHAKTCFAYKEGDQWSEAELKELSDRNQPPTVNNQVKVTIDRLVGQFVKQRTRIGFRGRNSPMDENLAQTLSEAMRFVAQNTGLEYEEKDMFEDGCTGGFGCLDVSAKFNDLFEAEIDIRHEDCFNIFPDPFSRRYDWNEDAGYICRAKWVDYEEAKELYPDKKLDLAAFIDQGDGFLATVDNFKRDNYIDSTQRRIRLVEVWYKAREKKSKFLSEGRKLEQVIHKMKVGIFSGWVLLEHKDSPHGHTMFPFVPYFAGRRKSGEPYSMIWTALTMQDAINKRESKALHLLNANQLIYEQGAVTNKADVAKEAAKPDGQVEINRGYIEKFRIDKNLELAISQFQMHGEAKQDYRRITGVNPDALGEKSEVRSGVGIARKQQMTDIITMPIFDNLRRTRAILSRVILHMIRNYWTEQKTFNVTDDLKSTKTLTLDANSLQALKENIYDVIVEDMPDTTTLQQEQLQIVANALPQVLPFGPAWTQILIEMSDIPKKDALLEKIKAMSQPPPSDVKFSVSFQWAEMTKEEKAVFAATKLGLPELAQVELMAGTGPAHLSKIAAEGQDPGQDAKSQVEIFKTVSDTQQARESHMMKMQLEKEKHDMAMDKAAMDFAKTVVAAKTKSMKEKDGG